MTKRNWWAANLSRHLQLAKQAGANLLMQAYNAKESATGRLAAHGGMVPAGMGKDVKDFLEADFQRISAEPGCEHVKASTLIVQVIEDEGGEDVVMMCVFPGFKD